MPRRLLSLGLALLAVAGVCAPAARARVLLGPRRIELTTPGGARAIVSRTPFGIAFLNSAGQTVLRELPAQPSPLPLAGVQSEFGTIGPPPAVQYAPLRFLVGAAQLSQTPAGQWEGTLQAVSEAGVQYSAQAVTDAVRQGNGVRLTVSTNDPTARVLSVSIAAGPTRDAIWVRARPSPADGVASMSDSFRSGPDEAFHGFGGRHDYLDQHGQEFYNWLQQENVSSGSAQGLVAPTQPQADRYLFPNGASAAYYVQSSFVSSRGYGFLLGRDELSHWRLASDRPDAWQTEVYAPGIDYLVVPASPARAIGQLTAVTGRQPAPPTWAAGAQYDREVKYPSDPAASYAREVQADIENIDRYHLHVDAYRLEGWAELSPPVLARLIAELRARRIHPLVYFRAFVGTDNTGTDRPADYSYAVDHGLVATRSDGSPYIFVSNFNAPAAEIDFTNPAAVAWWQGRIRAALDMGADGFMQDFGEQVQADMHFHDGETGATMHNRLPVLYNRATREAIDGWRATHPRRRIFYFTRAGYSGTPGDAAYENANFPGDETTDFSRASGLASLSTDMLNRAIGGAYGYGTDIGGYFDIGPYSPTTKELFLRWAEWAALSPLFRLHGSVLAGVHAPWSYDRQTVSVYKALTALHLRARPLILKLWRQADRTGIPVTRPLWLQYPGDPRAALQDEEWMLGPNILVAPVVNVGATSRSVYFPRGCWESPVTGRRSRGPGSQTVSAPLDRLPYFFRCGTSPLRIGRSGRKIRPSRRGRHRGAAHHRVARSQLSLAGASRRA